MNIIMSLKHVVSVLNQIAHKDNQLAKQIARDRIVCNQEVFEDDLVLTGKESLRSLPSLTILDLINSFFGIDGNGKGTIAAQFDKHGNLAEFYDLERRK
jgi:hypothetical protein